MKPRKKIKIIIIVLISAILVAAIIYAILQGVGEKKENIIKILPNEADIRIQDFVLTDVGQNNVRWEIRAKSAQYQKKLNLALFDQVQVKVTTEEGKVFIMTGKKGKMLTDKKDVEINGDVVITSDTGDKFTTDYLRYTDAQKKIYTDAPVVMENKQMKVQAVGLTIFTDKKELTLSSGVKAIIN
ncbi:MAG: LPS export ABC transporter periplasmic protein LptC [Smithellaceae bacterium]